MSKKKRESKETANSTRRVEHKLGFDPSDSDLPIGLRRFGTRLARFGELLEASRTIAAGGAEAAYRRHPHLAQAMPGHRLYVAQGRTPLFQLEALARIERGVRRDPEVFEDLLSDVKRLEDTLGDIDYWWVFLQSGEKRKLPEELVEWAANKHAQACGRLEGWLAAGDWVDHKYLADEEEVTLRVRQLGDALAEQEWAKPKKERRQVGEYFVERLRKVHADSLELDMDDLEGGLHELRRKLRWFSIYPSALDGLVTLDESAAPPPGWKAYMVESIVKSPFSKLPAAPPDSEPLAIPAPLFYALSWIIADLGRVKDAAQETEFIEQGLIATGSSGSPRQWLGDSSIGHHEAGEHARKVMTRTLHEHNLLLRLAEAFEAQL